ncbi:YidC/Oxa1 family membrane protein insertase [Sinosporangium siamense]|uniref:Membrane protein insertase YidC n=1 Tax=Sinosporangium siamense TaxID=1367973 RepID=A0A919V9Y3_9ACTN|nr:membrane protein insertase YidC [Sinosporangium siamense]GII95836.1 membrane protein [Sinosporangium siamense]
MFDAILQFTTGLLTGLAAPLTPLAGGNAIALAIVLFTLGVRLLLLPLTLMQVRATRAKARLAPMRRKLAERYKRNPERLQREVAALHAREGVSPFAGCLPMAAQVPFFWLLYQVSTGPVTSMGHALFGAPLGMQVAGVIGVHGLLSVPVAVFAAVFALMLIVAWLMSRITRRSLTDDVPEQLRRIMPLLSYGTVVFAAFIPLGAALYVFASSAWTAAERGLLYRPAQAV